MSGSPGNTPANPRICRYRVRRGHGRIPLRLDSAASFLKNLISSNFQKNPVNLSEFIVFFGNSGLSNAPGRFDILREFSLVPTTAIAG